MILSPDNRRIYTLPDLLVWVISNKDNAIHFIKSEKVKKWLEDMGYKDLYEKISKEDNIDNVVKILKSYVFSTNKEIIFSRAKAIEKIKQTLR